MNKEQILKLVNETPYHKLRAGETHRFIDMSIIVAEERMFVRQYSFGRKSWYHAFQEDPRGAIKCGDVIIPINGVIPNDPDTINPKIDQAYLDKYGSQASMMLDKRRVASTLELIPAVDE